MPACDMWASHEKNAKIAYLSIRDWNAVRIESQYRKQRLERQTIITEETVK
jgi:hypothetical protein